MSLYNSQGLPTFPLITDPDFDKKHQFQSKEGFKIRETIDQP